MKCKNPAHRGHPGIQTYAGIVGDLNPMKSSISVIGKINIVFTWYVELMPVWMYTDSIFNLHKKDASASHHTYLCVHRNPTVTEIILSQSTQQGRVEVEATQEKLVNYELLLSRPDTHFAVIEAVNLKMTPWAGCNSVVSQLEGWWFNSWLPWSTCRTVLGRDIKGELRYF